ncbi:MAG: stringent starvation protein A [Lysobacterales bacterium]|nr:MAG: stringent starvation protein A [Xanthomonadales bacterium]
MTLYTGLDDAPSHRARIVLAAKSLEIRIVRCDPSRPPEDLIDLNPFQSLPTLVDRDVVVYGPTVICEYLDERYPAPALLPGDPGGRAQARMTMGRMEQDWYGPAAELDGGERRDQSRARRELLEAMLAAEPLFRVKPWFLSDHFSLLDAAAAPILWRLRRWQVELPAAGAQAIERYAQRAFAHPAFRSSLSPAEQGMRE